MKILITGASGFIGFSFANYLCKKNKKINVIGMGISIHIIRQVIRG